MPAGALTAATSTVAPTMASASSTSSTISATAVLYAAPDINNDIPSTKEDPPSASNADWSGKKIKPPSMVLEESVNGFRGPVTKRHKPGKGKKVVVLVISYFHRNAVSTKHRILPSMMEFHVNRLFGRCSIIGLSNATNVHCK